MSNAAIRQARSAVARPLYAQVRAMLMERIRGQEWASGQPLPNEFVLASQYNVSIGTIRRAVEGLETAGVLVRKQGRGTFVAGLSNKRAQERFGRLRTMLGAPLPLTYRLLGVTRREATQEERARLHLDAGSQVMEMSHTVLGSGSAAYGIERGVADVRLLGRLTDAGDGDREPYAIYAALGVVVARVEETLSAIGADEEAAKALAIAPGAPTLQLTRLAFDLDERPVELRTARYVTANSAYGYRIGPARTV